MPHFLRHAVTVILTLGAFGSAHACPPPQHPPGWVEPTWNETVHAAYQKAQTVVMVEVVRVERSGTWEPNGPPAFGAKEKAFLRPIKAYKGNVNDVPKFVETRFSGTTCDRPTGLENRTKPIVFLDADGRLSMTVWRSESYEEALQQLEALRLASKR